MKTPRVLLWFACLLLSGHIIAGCQGRFTNTNSPTIQQENSKENSETLDESKVEIKQNKKGKNRARKRRHRTTESPESSSDHSSTETEVSDEEEDEEQTGGRNKQKSHAPDNVRPMNTKTNNQKAQPDRVPGPNPSTTARNSAPPPPPPLDGLSGEPRPSYPKFPISSDELLNGMGRLRKVDTKAPKTRRKPKNLDVHGDQLDAEPSAVDVE